MKKHPKTNEEIIDSYDYLANAVSSMDCTGLIPSGPVSEEDLESYQELYRFETPLETLKNKEK